MDRRDGIELLRQRVALARARLVSLWDAPPPPGPAAPGPWFVTGLGSSEAHARYLVALANGARPGAASFVPPSAFAVGALPAGTAAGTLVVFSQGCSANARIALARRGAFAHTVLFTAAEPDALAAAGRDALAALLRTLEAEGAERVATPEPDEYTILLRVVGPLCGYLRAHQWLEGQWPGTLAPLPADGARRLLAAIDAVPPDELRPLADDFAAGVEYNFAGPAAEYAQNLAYKRVEGLFLAEPARRDLLQFAHGPFQQNVAEARAQWVFASADPGETALVERLWPMYGRLAEPARLLDAPLPGPAAIFYFELLLNAVLLVAIEDCPYCQVHWPGKGLDAEGYTLDRPVA